VDGRRLEEAAATGMELAGTRILTLGYGSGDAAEAIPMVVMPGWAKRRGASVRRALADPHRPRRSRYRRCTTVTRSSTRRTRTGVFYIDRIGAREPTFDDSGIEYYRYEPEAGRLSRQRAASASTWPLPPRQPGEAADQHHGRHGQAGDSPTQNPRTPSNPGTSSQPNPSTTPTGRPTAQ
jgi:hypothetical protein